MRSKTHEKCDSCVDIDLLDALINSWTNYPIGIQVPLISDIEMSAYFMFH